MKKLLIILVFFCFSLSIHAQNLYRTDTVRIAYLDFYNQNWDEILDSLNQINSGERVLASLTIDGIVCDSVGVRFKGNSSYSPNRYKNPFNIDINYIKNQSIYGVTKLKLSNMFKDPSGIREVLSYEILRNYIPASEANFLFLYVNGVKHGLYSNIEAVDDDFCMKHFGSYGKGFFKCDPIMITGTPEPPPPNCLPIPGISSSLIFMGLDTLCYSQSYEIKSDYGWENLATLIEVLNNNTPFVHNFMNIDRTLWMLAFNNLFLNFDSYTGSGHNYYLLEDEFGRFNTIMWDLNESFGSKGGGVPGPFTLLDMQHLSTLWNMDNPERPLIRELLFIPEFKKMYFAHYRTLIDEFLMNNELNNRAMQLHNLIDTSVATDINYLYNYSDFQISLNQNVGTGSNQIFGVNVVMDERKMYLQSQPEIAAIAPTIDLVQQPANIQSSNEPVWVTAKISNSTDALLFFRDKNNAPFERILMLDDGLHNDGIAGDSIFGERIPPFSSGTKVDYFIYADNFEAGIFSPVRAQYEFYSYSVAPAVLSIGDLVINEFMAFNETTVQDINSEYDDWIEFYNNSTEEISLNGMFLSDDFANPYKWMFPNVSIPSNTYLIVWADEDMQQTGLHSFFKLSKSGEQIILSNADSTILDSITFGEQTSDMSFARIPNGTGDFQVHSPSFDGTNDISINEISSFENQSVEVYPNPCSEYTTLCFHNIETEKLNVNIYNIYGKSVFSLANFVGDNIKLTTTNFDTGIYLLKVFNNDGLIISKKIIVL